MGTMQSHFPSAAQENRRSRTTVPTSKSSLLSLPPEIRLKVYDFIFTSASHVTSDQHRMVWLTLGFDESLYRGFSSTLKYDLTIMRTNRQLYDEVSKHLLSNTKFTIELDPKQSIRSQDRSIGAIERIRFWSYITRLQLCAALDEHMIVRLQRLCKAIEGGRRLKEFGVTLAVACRPIDAVYLDQALAVLKGLCIDGTVRVNLSHPASDCDSETSRARCLKLQDKCVDVLNAVKAKNLGRY